MDIFTDDGAHPCPKGYGVEDGDAATFRGDEGRRILREAHPRTE